MPPRWSRKKRRRSRICGLKSKRIGQVLDRTLAWTGEERGKYRYAFFYEELVPRRTSMLQIADRIEALNEEALRRGDVKLGDLFGRLQFGLLAMIAVTLLGGVDTGRPHHISHLEAGRRSAAAAERKRPFASQLAGAFGAAGAGPGRRAARFVARTARRSGAGVFGGADGSREPAGSGPGAGSASRIWIPSAP